MSAWHALLTGLGRMAGRPGLLAFLWLVNVLVALPAALLVAGSLHESIGGSQVHETMRSGFDMGWFGEYGDEAEGLAASFDPTHSGPGGMLDNLEAWVDGRMFETWPAVIALGIGYVLLWALLMGGVIDRLAYPGDDHSTARFFERGGRYLPRFVRLMLLSGLLYWLVFRFRRMLFDWLEESLRDVTAERTALIWTVLASAGIVLLLVTIHVVFTYAKIAAVVEERRSMLLAAVRGLGFVLSYPLRTLGLYLGFGVLTVVLLFVWIWLAPGAEQATVGAVVMAFVAGQVFVMLRLYLRLSLLAGQAALYRSLRA
jgi:hypothetical protein